MTKAIVRVAACATLLWTGAVLAAPTTQQNCDKARIKAWAKYVSCVDGVLATVYGGATFDTFGHGAKFAKCRHKYFQNWTAFQKKASLAGSTCIGSSPFVNNGDGTVTDNLTGLTWEKKVNKDDTVTPADPHDADNSYKWSTGLPYKEDGTAFTDFLDTVNTGVGFAGANGWRLPTLAELQTIMLDFACTGALGNATCECPSDPCVDPALDAGNTKSEFYWSSTTYPNNPNKDTLRFAWGVSFSIGTVAYIQKDYLQYPRAVRGGL